MPATDLFEVIVPQVPACEIKNPDTPRIFLMLQKSLQLDPQNLTQYVLRVNGELDGEEAWSYLGEDLKNGRPALLWANGVPGKTWFHEAFALFATMEMAEMAAHLLFDICSKKPVEILQVHLKDDKIHLFRVAQIVAEQSVAENHQVQ